LARVTIEVPYQSLPLHQSDVRYAHGPDSAARPGVPAGETTEFDWNDSAVYPGTSRKFWVHVPAGYDPAEPASLMVFQDGWWYPYPELVPRVPGKPLRVFLQAGHRDLRWNEPERNWLADNLRVAAALAEAGYDFRLVLGDGGHSPNHGGVLLPDALRWLWRSD
jgi:hypothetical protein